MYTDSQAPDPIAALTQRIQSLEQASSQTIPDIKSLPVKITNYGFRRLEDFDKYEALALAEQLATTSRLKVDDDAFMYNAISLQFCKKSCLPVLSSFKSYYVALLADKEHSKVLDTVVKVDKTLKKQDSQASLCPGSNPGPSRPLVLICYACGMAGHISSRCYRRSARLYTIHKLLMNGVLFFARVTRVSFLSCFFLLNFRLLSNELGFPTGFFLGSLPMISTR